MCVWERNENNKRRIYDASVNFSRLCLYKIEAYAMSPSLVELEAWLVVVEIWLCPWILMPSMEKRGRMTIAAISRHGR